MMRTIDTPVRHRRLILAISVAMLFSITSVLAPATIAASEEQQGAQLLQSVQAGTKTCTSVTQDQFELIGEYVMGRMLGSSAAHEAMNRQMTAMMGAGGERQAHIYIGQRFAGCATGRAPASFGAMMGMMGAGMMGSAYGAYGGPGSGYRGMIGSGGMMGHGYGSPASSSGSSWSTADTVIVILLGLLLVAAIGAVVAWGPWRRRQSIPGPAH